jgi:multipile epidermal growth factor-like domains protein 8
MFRIKLADNSSDDQWEEVFARGGKLFDYRVVAHTTNFYPETDSLIIYGGIIASVARLSKLSDRIFSFNIIDHHWTEIFYPKTILREMSIPRERAFHSANIAGNFLIVFGGYSHRHNKEEICYDNQMYLYHLGCHAWVVQEALGAKRTNYPKKQGVFAHATALR